MQPPERWLYSIIEAQDTGRLVSEREHLTRSLLHAAMDQSPSAPSTVLGLPPEKVSPFDRLGDPSSPAVHRVLCLGAIRTRHNAVIKIHRLFRLRDSRYPAYSLFSPHSSSNPGGLGTAASAPAAGRPGAQVVHVGDDEIPRLEPLPAEAIERHRRKPKHNMKLLLTYRITLVSWILETSKRAGVSISATVDAVALMDRIVGDPHIRSSPEALEMLPAATLTCLLVSARSHRHPPATMVSALH